MCVFHFISRSVFGFAESYAICLRLDVQLMLCIQLAKKKCQAKANEHHIKLQYILNCVPVFYDSTKESKSNVHLALSCYIKYIFLRGMKSGLAPFYFGCVI